MEATNIKQEFNVTAKTLDQALAEAATRLNVEVGDVNYKVISQSPGFFFIGKKVEITVSPKSRKAGAESKLRSELYEQQSELTSVEITKLQGELVDFCKGICRFFVDEDVTVDTELTDGRLVLDIDHPEVEALVLKNGKLAESMEHVLRKKPRYLKRELPFRVFVDARGVRRKREDDLVVMAQDLSEKVHSNKRPIVLNYKSSYDRKIIHMALDKDVRVYTKSIGSGPNRKLMILPVKDRQGDAQEIEI